MMPRLLTVALVVCALVVGQPVSAQWDRGARLMQQAYKLLRSHPDSQNALREAEVLIRRGYFDDAARVLDDIARSQQRSRSREAREAAKYLFEAAEAARIEQSRLARPRPPQPQLRTPLPDPGGLFGSPPRGLVIDSNVPESHAALVVPLSRAIGERPTVVSQVQARFLVKFRTGANNADRVLRTSRSEHSERWRLAERHMRIAIVGSGNDVWLRDYAARLETQGFVVFFYKDCDCSEELVGAYMATAGEVMVSQSLSAGDSAFVGIEIAAAQRLREGRDTWFIVTADQVETARRAAAFSLGAAIVPATVLIIDYQ